MFDFLYAFLAVSYTHLDVYKRQDQLSQAEQLRYEVEISDGVNSAVSARQTVTVGSSESVDTSLAPALTITEIIPDTSNVNDADAYEFIEIYNNSNQDIDLKDYKLYYNCLLYTSSGIAGKADIFENLPFSHGFVQMPDGKNRRVC